MTQLFIIKKNLANVTLMSLYKVALYTSSAHYSGVGCIISVQDLTELNDFIPLLQITCVLEVFNTRVKPSVKCFCSSKRWHLSEDHGDGSKIIRPEWVIQCLGGGRRKPATRQIQTEIKSVRGLCKPHPNSAFVCTLKASCFPAQNHLKGDSRGGPLIWITTASYSGWDE